MRGHLLPSTISTLSATQEAHQCINPENRVRVRVGYLMFHHILSFLLHSSALCWVLRWVQGVLAHTGVISLRGLTFKLRHYLPEATAANGTWGIQIRLKQDQSDKEGFAIYQEFRSKTLKVGLVMMLASDWGSVFTN